MHVQAPSASQVIIFPLSQGECPSDHTSVHFNGIDV